MKPSANYQKYIKVIDIGALVGTNEDAKLQYHLSLGVSEAATLVRQMRRMADGGQAIEPATLAKRARIALSYLEEIEKSQLADGPTFALLRQLAEVCDLEMIVTLRQRQPEKLKQKDD